MKNIKYIILSSVIVLATGLVSCLDSEFDVDESYNRLFSPVSFETTNETSTTVDFTWKNIPAAWAGLTCARAGRKSKIQLI